MNKVDFKQKLKKLGTVRRKSISVSQEDLIRTSYLQSDDSLPLVVQPKVAALNLATWSEHNRVLIENKLSKQGAILFRDFQLKDVIEFQKFIQEISENILEYSYRSTPRSNVSDKIYTSTEYPAKHHILLHNEMSYSRKWPIKIAFYCIKKANEGGETPIADSRKVFARINTKIKEKFMDKKLMYVRNYGAGLDLTWQNAFNTNDKSEVETYCHQAGIELEWRDKDNSDVDLRTRQVCQVITKHPKTLETVWFNQAHLLHISNIEPTVREQLLANFQEEDLPRNVYYGDGSKIENSILEEIREIYQQESIIFPWQEGDVLLLDNLLYAHGRRPFKGSRRVVVGMAN